MPLVRQGGGRYDLACYVNYFTWIPPPSSDSDLGWRILLPRQEARRLAAGHCGDGAGRVPAHLDHGTAAAGDPPRARPPPTATFRARPGVRLRRCGSRARETAAVHDPRVWLRP